MFCFKVINHSMWVIVTLVIYTKQHGGCILCCDAVNIFVPGDYIRTQSHHACHEFTRCGFTVG